MKRGGPLKRYTPIRSRTKLQVKGHSDTAKVKEEIQAVLREIGLIRDGGCVFRAYPGHICTGFAKDGHLILQYDHLVTRANSATYADPGLGVIVCKGIHGWKSVGGNARKAQYDAIVRTLISPERVALWDRCEAEAWKPSRGAAYNWSVTLAALKQELSGLKLEKQTEYHRDGDPDVLRELL